MLEYFRLTTGFEAKLHRIALPVPFSGLLLRWNQALKLLLASPAPCVVSSFFGWKVRDGHQIRNRMLQISQLLAAIYSNKWHWGKLHGTSWNKIFQRDHAAVFAHPASESDMTLRAIGSMAVTSCHVEEMRTLYGWHCQPWSAKTVAEFDSSVAYRFSRHWWSDLYPLTKVETTGAQAISRLFDERALNNPAKRCKKVGLFLVAARSSDRFALPWDDLLQVSWAVENSSAKDSKHGLLRWNSVSFSSHVWLRNIYHTKPRDPLPIELHPSCNCLTRFELPSSLVSTLPWEIMSSKSSQKGWDCKMLEATRYLKQLDMPIGKVLIELEKDLSYRIIKHGPSFHLCILLNLDVSQYSWQPSCMSYQLLLPSGSDLSYKQENMVKACSSKAPVAGNRRMNSQYGEGVEPTNHLLGLTAFRAKTWWRCVPPPLKTQKAEVHHQIQTEHVGK